MLTPPMCIGVYVVLDVQERGVDRAHPFHAGSLIPSSSSSVEHPVDLGVHRHPAVARVDLDVRAVRVQARAPVDDRRRCASGPRRRRCPRRSGASRSVAEVRAALAVAAAAGEHAAGRRRSPRRATKRTVRSTCGETASGSRDRRAEHHERRDALGLAHGERRARARRRGSGRSGPTGLAAAVRESSHELLLQARSRSARRSPTFARMPLIATRWPAAAQPAAHHAQRAVAGHEARDQHHRAARRAPAAQREPPRARRPASSRASSPP